jgi:long-subunit fatty acid transport protein
MMRAFRVAVAFACVIALAIPCLAMMNKVGTAGALFLKIGMDPRRMAMGEAGVAVVGDASSAFSNPAGLAGVTGSQVFVTDTEWIADIRLVGGVYAFQFRDAGVVALSGIAVDYGSMPLVREAEADLVVEEFRPRDVAVGVSYATRWTDKLYVGGSFKYIDQSIADFSSRGIAFDVGTVYYTGFRSLRLAMATSNFGPDLRFDGTYVDKYYIGTAYVEQDRAYGAYDLPLDFRVGLAYDFETSPNSRLTGVLDATHPNDYSERIRLGAEYAWSEALFLRCGYTTNAEEMGLAAGCGLKLATSWGVGSMDYAYTDFGVFQGVHRVSLGLSF